MCRRRGGPPTLGQLAHRGLLPLQLDSLLTRACQGFHFLDFVVVERGRRILMPLVGVINRVGWQPKRVAATAIPEDRPKQIAVLVDVARREALLIQRAQEGADLSRGDLRSRPVTESRHDSALARAGSPLMRDTGFADKKSIVGNRRRLRAFYLLNPYEPRMRKFADGPDVVADFATE